ncbi:MAG: class II fructose-bisphosphate aldolase [Halanaerobiales bacterium]|nr:class II fructose-bisphosphate aldolase [Halanaerobiales bacterium]
MPLVDTKKILNKAKNSDYGIGSFNIYNLETTQAVMDAAEENKSPVMIQAWSGIFDMGLVEMETLVSLVKTRIGLSNVPASLHLDHGEKYETICKAIRAGFTSVMIDASTKSLEENIALTKKVVETAHAVGVTVEAELGHVGEEKGDSVFTDPDEAKYFVKETDVDYLAISIGSIHGYNVDEVKLNIELLRKIKDKIDIPLVLHGSSYLSGEELGKAVKNGIDKVNINTEVSVAMIEGFKKALEDNPDTIYNNIFTDQAKKEMVKVVKEKMDMLNSSNQL